MGRVQSYKKIWRESGVRRAASNCVRKARLCFGGGGRNQIQRSTNQRFQDAVGCFGKNRKALRVYIAFFIPGEKYFLSCRGELFSCYRSSAPGLPASQH